MAPTYKLIYFNVRARAEPTRMVFAYAGVPYEDVRIAKEDWPSHKPKYPWGSVPVLEVDGKILAQSNAILRYVGTKFNLAGENDFEAAKCDELLEAIADLGNACRPAFVEQDETKKKELMGKVVSETMPNFLTKLVQILEKNNGLFVGKKITYADIGIAANLQFYGEMFEKATGTNLFAKHPALQAHQDKIFNSPGIKEWVAKRP